MTPRPCQWCGSEFESAHPSKVYCSTKCKNEFGNFVTVIGKRIAPVAMAWRIKRGGEGVGSSALRELCTLLDRANEEFRNRPKAEGVAKLPTIGDHYRAVRRTGTGARTAMGQ